VTGNILDSEGNALSETVEVFMRDPVLCVQDLFNNVAFRDVIAYAPERVFSAISAGSFFWAQRSLHEPLRRRNGTCSR
jgi:hypothetical protein